MSDDVSSTFIEDARIECILDTPKKATPEDITYINNYLTKKYPPKKIRLHLMIC